MADEKIEILVARIDERTRSMESKLDDFILDVKKNYAQSDQVDENRRRIVKIEATLSKVFWTIGGWVISFIVFLVGGISILIRMIQN